MNTLSEILNTLLPETMILILMIINLILAAFIKKKTFKIAEKITVIGLIISSVSLVFTQIDTDFSSLSGLFISNIFTIFFKTTILISALLMLFSTNYLVKEKRNKAFNYYSILLFGLFSALFLIDANNFIIGLIAVELLSVFSILISNFQKTTTSIKDYLVPFGKGFICTIISIIGIVLLYLNIHEINFSVINNLIANIETDTIFSISGLFIIAGLLAKLFIFPAGNFIINTCQNSKNSVNQYLSIILTTSAIAYLSRIFIFVFGFSMSVKIVVAILSVICMIFFAIKSLREENIKSIYAYNNIVHCFLMILALTTLNVYAVSGVIFYVFTYIFMNLGIWNGAIVFNQRYKAQTLKDYRGIFYTNPYFSIALTINILALAGLPPTSGAISKFYIFSSMSLAEILWQILLIFALLSYILSAISYFKIIKEIFSVSDKTLTIARKLTPAKLVLYVTAIITLCLFFFPETFIKLSEIIAYYI